MDHQDLINICIFEQSEGLLFSDKQVTEGSGELGPITNSAWSIFWIIRITCLEDSAHPSGELGLRPSEFGLPQFYHKITY